VFTVQGKAMSSNPKYQNAALSSYYASFRADDTLISILPAFDFNSHDDNQIPNRLFQSTLMSTNFGPFKAGMEATVPLWMAVVLQQRSFAQIVLPEWLSTSNLSHIIRYEKKHALLFPTTSLRSATGSKSVTKHSWNAEDGDNSVTSVTVDDDPSSQGTFSLPENYYEVALRLTSAAQSSAPSQDTSHSVLSLLVQDLFEIRVDKLRQQFQSLMEETVRRNLGVDGIPSASWTDLIINVTGIGTQELTAIRPYVQQAMQDIYSLASSSNEESEAAKVPPPEGEVTATQRRSSLVKRRLR
jgi:GINS complex protein